MIYHDQVNTTKRTEAFVDSEGHFQNRFDDKFEKLRAARIDSKYKTGTGEKLDEIAAVLKRPTVKMG